MQDIKFQRNVFQTFYAVMAFKVGGATVIEIGKGDSFEYDGTILKYAGHEVQQPSMRGSIKAGWAVLNEAEIDDGVSTKLVARNIAKSQTRNTNLNRVERTTSELMVNDVDEGQVAEVGQRRGQGLRDAPRKILVSQSPVDEGTTVARLRTRSNLGPIDITRTSGLAQKLEERHFERPEYLNTPLDPIPTRRVARTVVEADSEEGVTVGHTRKSEVRDQGGVTLNHTKKASAPEVALTDTSAKKIVKNLSSDPKIRVAQRIYPSFPADWSFEGRPSERAERVRASVIENDLPEEFVEAAYAAENDQGKKALIATFPSLF